MRIFLKGKFIYLIVLLISILLLAQILLTKSNNKILIQNKEQQLAIQRLNTYYDQIGKLVIHALDIGLRGYAIVQTDQFVQPMLNAREIKDSILLHVEQPLQKLGYDLSEFNRLKDSIDTYVSYMFKLKELIDEGKRDEFEEIFSSDRGALLWVQYVHSENRLNIFQERLFDQTEASYYAALKRNTLLQILIFLIAIPTLLYTAFYTSKVFRLLELLKLAEEDKNKVLQEQNTNLELLVAERTSEILAQNEEITAQSEEIVNQRNVLAEQYDQLHHAKELIEAQNEEIQTKNEHLEVEVRHRTEELENANRQLIDHNNQLEQFSFITAHNLRAPLARILGLAQLLEIAPSHDEKEMLMQLLISSTRDLDEVIKDLNVILDIRKHTGNLIKINLPELFIRVNKVLKKEQDETHAHILTDFKVKSIHAVAPYVESILYNLISNAIKYRHPDRPPEIKITTVLHDDYVCLEITDNGLGIDLSKHRHNLFNLYKRFHLHMEGKGLGLYLVKTQIMSMGGKIEVDSSPETGTTFRVFFKK